MQVGVAMDEVSITLGNKGMTLQVADNAGKHVGNLRIGKATVEWRKGKTPKGKGKKLSFDKLIALLEEG
ncbi:MAG TPA: hypothetical protein VMT37_00815 [Solirubrobacterales bacterium]|nr:hypothetical protein [Solirubrobacterales bacterium]